SARAATLAMGGTYYEPGHPDAPVAFQPLGALEERADRAWAADFVGTMLELQGATVGPEVKKAIDEALVALSVQPLAHRTLTSFAGLLSTYRRELGDALRPYTMEGPYGQIFDSD